VLWLPHFWSCVTGTLALSSALVWYVGALGVAWIAVLVLEYLVTSYIAANKQAEHQRAEREAIAGGNRLPDGTLGDPGLADDEAAILDVPIEKVDGVDA